MIRRTNLTTLLIISVFLAGFAPAVAVGETIYVDTGAGDANNGSSWADAYLYLQDALAAATSGDDIWVAAGTYYPDANTAVPGGSNDRTATFQLISGVGIYGGFAGTEDPCTFNLADRDFVANETTLSGDINTPADNTDNSYHVVTGSATNATAVLNGFTITAGKANGSGLNRSGGGMYNNSGSPTVTNCTFSVNVATYGGGMHNYDSSPMVTNCTFSGNELLFQGKGGGMFNGNSSNPTVTNCTFSGNSADYSGGGMYNQVGSSPTVTNCTFSGNSATRGGGIRDFFLSDNSTVTNCILWGNSDSGGSDESAQIDGDAAPTINYSCVQGWSGNLGGWGNIGDDPNFVDPNGPDGIVGTEDDNLRLLPGSPCIDAGGSIAVSRDTADLDGDGDTHECLPFDLDGNARLTDDPNTVDTGNPGFPGLPIVDMGAYERYGFCGSGVYLHPDGDISGPDGVQDCLVDFYDFAVMAAHWLEYTGPE